MRMASYTNVSIGSQMAKLIVQRYIYPDSVVFTV